MQILPPSKWWRNPKSRRRMAGVVAVIAAAVGIPAIVAANGQPGSSAGESSLPVEVAYASPGTASGETGSPTLAAAVGVTSGEAVSPVHTVAETSDQPAIAIPTSTAGADDVPELWWDEMSELNYRTGEMSQKLTELNGKIVRIPGFMVPLEDFAEEVTEFLLVPYFGACIHTPPPPPNQMVYVPMEGSRKTTLEYWNPVWIEGRLLIREMDSPYGAVSYQLVGQKITLYEE